jgi:serine/threonine-protein kinase
LRQADARVALELRTREEPERSLPDIPLALPVVPLTEVLRSFHQAGFLAEAALNQFIQAEGKLRTREAVAAALERELGFTPYQVKELLACRGQDLVLGPYLILDRLGEGGTGKVFKAWHQRIDRLVALKVIRQELMGDEEVVGRFYREIKLVGQLVHPHIVLAYDAGPIGAAHVLVMEFLEGIDLARLVRDQGPLAVSQARDYVRQAAVGLQYIHERGLVHRDIKPGNLLLARGKDQGAKSVIKILDLGLGRLQKTVNGAISHVVTPTGAVMMGTPDYLAPEQAANFHAADIRADIYGLGCSFYYLLTGRPPFSGSSLVEKVAKHLLEEPASVETFRSDLPAGLAAVLGKMLAKAPEQRFQTPAEVIAALDNPETAASAATESPALPVALPVAAPVPSSRKRNRILALAGTGALLAVGILCLKMIPGALSGPSQSSRPQVAASQPHSGRDAPTVATEALRALILPSPGEDKWLQIPWMTSLWQARKKAAAEDKPIMLWVMSGHPLGCTCPGGIDGRTHAFADPDIIGLARDSFIPVAADDWYLRRRRDSEGQFFQQVCDQSPRKGAADDSQGLYCFTAAGKLLGFRYAGRNTNDVREMLRNALEEWKKLPAGSRKPATALGEPESVDASLTRLPPSGAVVVNVYTRPLEKDAAGNYRRTSRSIPGGALAARDRFWLTADECQALAGLSLGDTQPGTELARAIERLCRYHLLDDCRGEPPLWAPDQVRSQKLRFKVQRSADHVLLSFEGPVLLASQRDPAQAERGYDARLSGTIGWDRQRKRIDRFDVLAIGDAWGEGVHDPGARPGRKPLGIVFELSKGGALDAVPPFGARMVAEYLGQLR